MMNEKQRKELDALLAKVASGADASEGNSDDTRCLAEVNVLGVSDKGEAGMCGKLAVIVNPKGGMAGLGVRATNTAGEQEDACLVVPDKVLLRALQMMVDALTEYLADRPEGGE